MTRQRAIDAKCKDCIYDREELGTWREQCTACTITGCPLHAFRPVAKGVRRNGVIEASKVEEIRDRIGGY